MSREIDERIVEMQFDNRQFETNVKTSMSTLDKLKRALKFEDASAGLENLIRNTSKLNFGSMSGALDTVKERFSAMGIVGMTILQNLTNAALGFAKNMLTAIPQKIAQGGWARAMKIETAKFQLEGLGIAWKEISQDIDYGVAGTAYGLDEAAVAASQLATAGIEFGDAYKKGADQVSTMGRALLGISGVAGQTNSDFQSMADIFIDVASAGRLTGDAVTRLQYRGLNAKQDLAKFFNGVNDGSIQTTDTVLNTIKEITNGSKVSAAEVSDYITKKKIDAETFYTAMHALYGEHAKDANNTLTGIISNINAAFSKIGADFATPLIQGAIAPLGEIRLRINDVRAALTPLSQLWAKFAPVVSKGLTDFIAGIQLIKKDTEGNYVGSWIQTIGEGLVNLVFDLMLVIEPIREAFREIFPPTTYDQMQSLADRFKAFTEKLIISKEAAEQLKTTFKGVFAVFDIIKEAVIAVVNAILPADTGFKDIGSSILSFTSGLAESILSFRDFVKETDFFAKKIESIKTFISNFLGVLSQGLGPTISVLKQFGGSILEKVASFFGKSGTALSNFGRTASGAFSPIKALFDIFTTVVNAVFTSLETLIPKVMSLFGTMIENLISNFSKLAKFVMGGDIETILTTLSFSSLIFEFKESISSIRGMIKDIKFFGVINNVTDGINSLSDALASVKKSMDMKALVQMATAVGILAASLLVLSMLDIKQLGIGLAGVSTLLWELYGLAVALKKGDFTNTLPKVTGAIIGMSVAVLLLSSAVKSLGKLEFTQLAKGIGGMSAILWELVAVCIVLAKYGGQMPRIASGLIGMAAALLLISTAVKKLGELDGDTLVNGILAVSILLVELTTVSMILSAEKAKSMMKGASGLISMAAALVILTVAVKQLGQLSVTELVKGLGSVFVLLMSIGAFATILSKTGTHLMGVGTGLLLFAAGMLVLSAAFKKLGGMKPEELEIALGGLVGLLMSIGIFAGLMSATQTSIVKVGAGMLLISGALIIMSGALKNIGSLNPGELAVALGGILGLLIEIGVFATVMSASQASLAGVGAGLIVMSGALILMAAALNMLSSVEHPIQALLTLAGALVIIGGAAALLSGVVVPMLGIAAAIALLAVGAGVLAIALAALSTAFVVLEKAMPSVINVFGMVGAAIMDAVEAIVVKTLQFIITAAPLFAEAFNAILQAILQIIVTGIPSIVEAGALIMTGLLEIMAEYVPQIISLGGELIVGFLEACAEYIPQIIDLGFQIIEGILGSIRDHIGEVTTTAIDIVLEFIAAIQEKLSDIIQAGIDLALSFINGMADGIRDNTQATIDAVDNLMDAIIQAIAAWLEHFLTKGGEMVVQLAQGINEDVTTPVEAIKTIVQSVIDAIGDFVKQAFDAGANLVQGFIDGLGSLGSTVWEGAKNIGAQAIEALKSKGGLDEHSPSKKSEKAGRDFDQGFIDGVNAGADKVKTTAKNLAKDVVQPLTDAGTGIRKSLVDGGGAAIQEYADRYLNGLLEPELVEVIEDLGNVQEATEQTTDVVEKSAERSVKATKKVAEATDEVTGVLDYGSDVIEEFYRRYGEAFAELGDTAAVEASVAAVELLAETTYEASKKAEEATDTAKKSSEVAKASLDEIKKAFQDLRANIQKSIQSGMDIFTKFDDKTELSADNMLENMKSQIKGVSTWAANLQTLAARGIDQGLLKKLAEMGPKSYEYVNAFVTMSGEQLAQANDLFAQSLVLPETATTQILSSYAYAGLMATTGFAQGLDTQAAVGPATETAKNTLNALESGLEEHSPSRATRRMGVNLNLGLVDGIHKDFPVMIAVKALCRDVVRIFREELRQDIFVEIGSNISQGLANGVQRNAGAVLSAVSALAAQVVSVTRNALRIASPSKIFAGIGRYIDYGLAEGIEGNVNVATSATESLSKAVIDAMYAVNDILQNGPDLNPVITPILDLSQVQSGINGMNGMFNATEVIGAASATRLAFAGGYGGIAGSNNTNNFTINVTGNDNASASDIADEVINRINIEYQRQKAAWV